MPSHIQTLLTTSAAETTRRLPYPALVHHLAALLADPTVQVPQRLVVPLAGGASLFVMPALDQHTAITKLITFTPANAATGRPAIQGDVLVFDVPTGERRLLLDGPVLTARRTAAVTALAAMHLATCPTGPALIVGAGVQGTAHLEAFAEMLGVRSFYIASRSLGSPANAQRLALHAESLGLQAQVVTDANAALADCPLAVTCTPARHIALAGQPRSDAFIAAVGAFTPAMAELHPDLCRYLALHGRVVLDTPDAAHEAGDLLRAGLNVASLASLADVVRASAAPTAGPVLFKSCGWAGWDLAAARCALAQGNQGLQASCA